jgi:hypothetical protein
MNVRHFHVFGNEAWAHIPDEKRKAIYPKSRSAFLLVIQTPKNAKDYRIR